MTVDIVNTTISTSPFYCECAYALIITKGCAIGASRSASLATFAALRVDVWQCVGEVQNEDAARSGDFIAVDQLGSGCKGSKTIVKLS